MRTEQVNEMIADITRQLLQKRSSDGIWRGCLSSSAISTSVAIFALYQIDSDTYEPYIRKGTGWLKKTMRADEGVGTRFRHHPSLRNRSLRHRRGRGRTWEDKAKDEGHHGWGPFNHRVGRAER